MRYIYLILLAILLAGCGHPESFRIEGEIEGKPTMNLRVVYTGPKGVVSALTASRDGKFNFEGVAERPTIVQVFDNDYRLLGRSVAVNGEDLQMKLNRDNPFEISVSGDELAESWATWLRERADSLLSATPAVRNAIIARYIKANPANPVGSLLLMTEYDASRDNAEGAAELWAVLNDDARFGQITAGYAAMLDRVTSVASREKLVALPYMIKGGKIVVFKPSSSRLNLIVLTGPADGRDSIAAMLAKAGKHKSKGRFDMVELSMIADTVEWRRSVHNDTVKWTQGWIAGGISSSAVGRLGIPELPYFIVADSAGTQLWRGGSASEALSVAVEKLSELD